MYMKMVDKDRKGMVLRIERSSIHDGAGFRTVVFLKGCPLKCAWCSTPESQSFSVETTAENTYGTLMTVEEVVREIRKDSLFFFISTGGVTLSGGEILAQPEFARAILQNAKKECLHTAVETTFFAKWETIESMLPYINTAHVDLKMYNNELHKKYTGVSNELILENLSKTNDYEGRIQLIVRVPVIPGINDTEEEMEQIGKFCSGLNKLSHIQLLPYHKLGTATYAKLGREYLLKDTPTPNPEDLEKMRVILRKYVDKVI